MKLNKKYVVIGSGDISKNLCQYPNVIGYVKHSKLDEIIDLGTNKIISNVNPSIHEGIIGIGKCKYKEESFNEWQEKGYKFGTLIHHTAYVDSSAIIGEGTVIMPLSYVDQGSVIGKGTIIGGQSCVHYGSIGDFSHFGFQVKILPRSNIGNLTFIGTGATVLEKKIIGKNCVVGANSIVKMNLKDNQKYFININDYTLTNNNKNYPLTSYEKNKV